MRNSNKTLLDIPSELIVLEAKLDFQLLEEEKKYLRDVYEVVDKKSSKLVLKSIKTLVEEKPEEIEVKKYPLEILMKYPLLATLRDSDMSEWFYFLLSKGGYL